MQIVVLERIRYMNIGELLNDMQWWIQFDSFKSTVATDIFYVATKYYLQNYLSAKKLRSYSYIYNVKTSNELILLVTDFYIGAIRIDCIFSL